MPSCCIVSGCLNKYTKDCGRKFFQLPRATRDQSFSMKALATERRQQWLNRINRPNFHPNNSSRSYYVCCDHFVSGKPAPLADKTNPDWVPTVNMGNPRKYPQTKTQRRTKATDEMLKTTLSGTPTDLSKVATITPGLLNLGTQPRTQYIANISPPQRRTKENLRQTVSMLSNSQCQSVIRFVTGRLEEIFHPFLEERITEHYNHYQERELSKLVIQLVSDKRIGEKITPLVQEAVYNLDDVEQSALSETRALYGCALAQRNETGNRAGSAVPRSDIPMKRLESWNVAEKSSLQVEPKLEHQTADFGKVSSFVSRALRQLSSGSAQNLGNVLSDLLIGVESKLSHDRPFYEDFRIKIPVDDEKFWSSFDRLHSLGDVLGLQSIDSVVSVLLIAKLCEMLHNPGDSEIHTDDWPTACGDQELESDGRTSTVSDFNALNSTSNIKEEPVDDYTYANASTSMGASTDILSTESVKEELTVTYTNHGYYTKKGNTQVFTPYQTTYNEKMKGVPAADDAAKSVTSPVLGKTAVSKNTSVADTSDKVLRGLVNLEPLAVMKRTQPSSSVSNNTARFIVMPTASGLKSVSVSTPTPPVPTGSVILEHADPSQSSANSRMTKSGHTSDYSGRKLLTYCLKPQENSALASLPSVCAGNQAHSISGGKSLYPGAAATCSDKIKILFGCEKCNRKFSSMQACSAHQRMHRSALVISTLKKSYKCDVCNEEFKSEGRMKIHRDAHFNIHKCRRCDAEFPDRKNLQKHKEKHWHENQRKQRKLCEECGKCFSGAQSLRKHKLIHQNVKPHKCVDCGKEFRRRQHLNDHRRKHTGDVKHICDRCGKRYLSWNALRMHVRIVHQGERPSYLFPRKESELL